MCDPQTLRYLQAGHAESCPLPSELGVEQLDMLVGSMSCTACSACGQRHGFSAGEGRCVHVREEKL